MSEQDVPGILWRLLVRDPPARLRGDIQSISCQILWILDWHGYFPYFASVSSEFGEESFRRYLEQVSSEERYRITGGRLKVPAELTFIADGEHEIWLRHDTR